MNINEKAVCTYIGALIAVIVTVIGGVAVIMGSLSFEHYIRDLTYLMGGVGILGIARAIRLINTPKG